MMTSTSEMSGNASRGMCCMDQMPASTSRSVPVKTKKRLRAHHSIQRLITLHSSPGAHGQLLGSNGLPAFLGCNTDLPGASAAEIARAFVHASALVAQYHHRAHRRHAHSGHGGHEECDGHLGAFHGLAICTGEPDAQCIVSLMRRRGIRGELNGCLCG